MTFFSKIKSYFGFGVEDEDYEDKDDVIENGTSEGVADTQDGNGTSVVVEKPEISTEMKARIFDHAVAVFNEALPDFLSRSVDPQAQSQRLAEALDKGLDEYLSTLFAKAEQHAESKLKVATQNAMRESERLRSDVQQIEQQRATLREQQLSADRRYRALVERVAGLETQLATCEAEREQIQLENRSLLNKLKVADIQPGVVDEMAKEIERLKTLAENTQATSGISTEEYETVKATAEQLNKELADLRSQQDIAQAMYNDLNNQYATERDARKEAEAALEEARKIVDGISEIQEQMTKVDAIIKKRDERIESLKADNKKLREDLAAAEAAANRALMHTDGGLFAVMSDEKDADTSATKSESKISAADMAAIEDEFECPEWFVSEPAPGEVSPLLQSDAEFGYQEPSKKPRKPENDAQLSLF